LLQDYFYPNALQSIWMLAFAPFLGYHSATWRKGGRESDWTFF
jgi:hypothetical protein